MNHPARGQCGVPLPSAVRTSLAASLSLFAAEADAQTLDGALVLAEDSAHVYFGDPGDAFDLVPGGERTFALWLRYTRPEYHAKIFDKRGKDRPFNGFAIFVHQHTATIGVWFNVDETGDPSALTTVGTAGLRRIGDGAWHHVAVVQADTLVRGYVNGRLDFEYNVAPILDGLANPYPLVLGWNLYDGVSFAGEMDEVSVWHRALSAREIRSLMYRSLDGDEEGLAAYWPMNDGPGALVRDHGPHGWHGQASRTGRAPATRPRAPPFRETWRFYLLVTLFGASTLYGSMRLYAQRIERQKRRLERAVAERTGELAAAYATTAEALGVVEAQARRLAELDQAKSRFFTNISHEFRTPLSLIIGPLTDIREGRLGRVDAAAREQVAGALRNGHRLLRLTRQLLDLARLEAGELRLTVYRLDLGALLEGLAMAFTATAERRGVRFERVLPAGPLWLYGDPQHLETAFTNLLSNAFKFTSAGGAVRLSVEWTDDSAAVRVEDTGPGIAAHELPRVFERFYQTETGLRRGHGSGIGLALTRELVELHGGAVHAESTKGVGTTFTVVMPLGRDHLVGAPQVVALHDAPPPVERSAESGGMPPATAVLAGAAGLAPAYDPPSPAGPPAAEDGEGDGAETDRPVVLVVDDNAEIRAYVRLHLAGPYRVDEAADGKAALARARASVPDVIVSDLMMPGMDGIELLRAIRGDADLDFVPVILLTARAELEDRLNGLGHGADDYLTKPFVPAELAARIANLIAHRHRLRDRLRTAAAAVAGAPTDGLAAVPAGVPADRLAMVGPPADGLDARLRAAVEAHLGDEDFGVDALARAVFMERTGLYRHMMDELGTAPSDFIRDVRLARAAELLRDDANTVAEVAYAVGYNSVSSFSRRFRDRFGSSPGAWPGRADAPADS